METGSHLRSLFGSPWYIFKRHLNQSQNRFKIQYVAPESTRNPLAMFSRNQPSKENDNPTRHRFMLEAMLQ
jgi:hypothetical protein